MLPLSNILLLVVAVAVVHDLLVVAVVVGT
jgi:hypothetical protein